jgi:hypothetical protein
VIDNLIAKISCASDYSMAAFYRTHFTTLFFLCIVYLFYFLYYYRAFWWRRDCTCICDALHQESATCTIRYYNLCLVCGAKTPVRDALDVWPPLPGPLIVWDDCNQRNVRTFKAKAT